MVAIRLHISLCGLLYLIQNNNKKFYRPVNLHLQFTRKVGIKFITAIWSCALSY